MKVRFLKIDRPIELDEYVKQRRQKHFVLRSAGAGLLLLALLAAKLLYPAGAELLRSWVTGGSHVNDAVAAFYACIDGGDSLPEAVEAFCYQLDG